MKRYISCFLLFSGAAALCFLLAFWVMGNSSRSALKTPGSQADAAQESTAEGADGGVTEPQAFAAAGQRGVSHVPADGRYFLIAEQGVLMVYEAGASEGTSMHMPLSEIAPEEQEKLRDGLWFSTMMEVYSYLESCTS